MANLVVKARYGGCRHQIQGQGVHREGAYYEEARTGLDKQVWVLLNQPGFAWNFKGLQDVAW